MQHASGDSLESTRTVVSLFGNPSAAAMSRRRREIILRIQRIAWPEGIPQKHQHEAMENPKAGLSPKRSRFGLQRATMESRCQ